VTITDDNLSRWEALCAAATPGPWKSCGASDGQCPCCVVWSLPADYPILRGTNEDDGSGRWQDAAFAAESRTAVPGLCAEVRRLREVDRILSERICEHEKERDALRVEVERLRIIDADREALRFLLTTYGKVPEDRGEREVYDNHVHAARLLCERLIGEKP
jgi:hypothetical protein